MRCACSCPCCYTSLARRCTGASVWLTGSLFGASEHLESHFRTLDCQAGGRYCAKRDAEGLSRLVSTSFAVLLGVGAFSVLAYLLFVLLFFDSVFNIPMRYEELARSYALLTLAAFAISYPGSVHPDSEGAQRYDDCGHRNGARACPPRTVCRRPRHGLRLARRGGGRRPRRGGAGRCSLSCCSCDASCRVSESPASADYIGARRRVSTRSRGR